MYLAEDERVYSDCAQKFCKGTTRRFNGVGGFGLKIELVCLAVLEFMFVDRAETHCGRRDVAFARDQTECVRYAAMTLVRGSIAVS